MPQEQGHDHRVDGDRGLPGPTVLQPPLQIRSREHDGADRPDPAEQETHGGWVGVRHHLDVGAEQALGIGPDPREPVEPRVAEELPERRVGQQHEAAETRRHHPPQRRLRRAIEGAVRIEEPELVRQQQHERDVAPPHRRPATLEPDDVGADRARDHHDRHTTIGRTPVQSDHPRRHGDDDEIHPEEPERAERQRRSWRQEQTEQRRVAHQPRAGRRADIEQVHPDDGRAPDDEEHQRGAEQPHHAVRTNEPSLSPRRRAASSDTRFEKPPTKKKMGITCSTQVASQSHGRHTDRAGGAEHAVLPPHDPDRPMPDDHRTDARRPQEVHDPVARSGRRIGQGVEGGCAHAHGVPLVWGRVKRPRPPDWQDGRMGRRWRIVLGVVLVLAGLCATIAGLAIALLVGTDGSIGLPPTRIVAAGTAITLPQLDVPKLPRRSM